MFQRFFDSGLAQSSYLVGCMRTRQAVVVDPRRDVDVYLSAARDRGLTIVDAIETHIHADFVSGARELSASGVRTVAGPGAGLAFPHHEAAHGEPIAIGDVRLTILHTPGHTPEHISVLVEEPDAPPRVLTGDTLFVSAVGRPDLLGEDAARRLADQLYDSLHSVLLSLADDVEVWPGHGAGFLCGAGIGSAEHSTIGQERRVNQLLQYKTKAAFVNAVLADLPETPPYFPRMKVLNRQGPAILGVGGGAPALPALEMDAVRELLANDALVLDLRSADAFATGHPTGALHLAAGPKVGYWAGWVVPGSATVVLVVDGATGEPAATDARLQLWRVGIDSVAGFVRDGLEAWRAAPLPVSSIERWDIAGLLERMRGPAPPTIVDVRSRKEFDAGHLDDAMYMPLHELQAHAAELPAAPVATLCETGYRSSLAASLLARQGTPGVASVAGGMADYRRHGGS